MWNEPTKAELATLPKLYESENMSATDVVIRMHFFMGSADWYVAEYDGKDRFFGYVNLGDPQCAEWGYFLLSELRDICFSTPHITQKNDKSIDINISTRVDRDLYWEPKPFGDIDIEAYKGAKSLIVAPMADEDYKAYEKRLESLRDKLDDLNTQVGVE
tara:strand:+ start:1264 stop:1740 length:477 start_codon:yes stop_codon:yes gene_type:complete